MSQKPRICAVLKGVTPSTTLAWDLRFCSTFFFSLPHDGPRHFHQTSTCLTQSNLGHLFGANVVTLHSKFRVNDTPELHRVGTKVPDSDVDVAKVPRFCRRRTILKLTYWVRGTNPLILERKRGDIFSLRRPDAHLPNTLPF